jgi:thioredoxin
VIRSQKKRPLLDILKKKRKELAIMAAMNMNKEQFDKAMAEGKPILVDFWAPWCSYCRRIGPAYDKVAAQYAENLDVVKVNIDDEPELANLEHIEVIPTLVLYKGGKALGSIVAPESKAAIDGFIQENLG